LREEQNKVQQYYYKFMPINEFTFKNLLNNQIWFSSPLNFNDPFDLLIPFKKDFTDVEFRRRIPQIPPYTDEKYEDLLLFYKNNPSELEKWTEIGQKRFAERIKIACFCKEKSNIIMWSHYANYHKGICLKFDSAKDYHFFHEEDWERKKFPIKKVKYPEKLKLLNFFKDNEKFFESCTYTKYYE
jgi:hypothetical protein